LRGCSLLHDESVDDLGAARHGHVQSLGHRRDARPAMARARHSSASAISTNRFLTHPIAPAPENINTIGHLCVAWCCTGFRLTAVKRQHIVVPRLSQAAHTTDTYRHAEDNKQHRFIVRMERWDESEEAPDRQSDHQP